MRYLFGMHLLLIRIYQNYLPKIRKCREATGSVLVTRVCQGILPCLVIKHGKKPLFSRALETIHMLLGHLRCCTPGLHNAKCARTSASSRTKPHSINIGQTRKGVFFNIYTFQRDTQCSSTDCLLMHRCQLYMFQTVMVHPQELLFRCCICRLWYVVRNAL